ncbi:response regulator transcription factor [Paenibacillus abyssi]|uniref:DNA-binding response regulator n=1 Tax=Paenibacillus abyssi TaxID=1340531 RepID=A0A917CVJ6_9BACL|nr:response regulator [Paenibacillus abyssi]GGF99195.1 DNA-binding response regulator [Paenibacillus abyssi]
MNIFLVEDERWALAELVELFKIYEPEHQIYAFENGEDALAAASHTKPQLVLTDINMPGMDGLELISRLNRIDQTVKGIILSVHDQFEYAQKGVKIGVIDYLLKPVKKNVLYQTIDKSLEGIKSDDKQKEERLKWSITQMMFDCAMNEDEHTVSIYHRKYCIALLLLENWATKKSWKDTYIVESGIKKQFTYRAGKESEVVCVDIDSQRKVLLLPMTDDLHRSAIISNLRSFYQQLNHHRLHVHLSYVFKKEKERMHTCFDFLNKQIEEHMLLGNSTWIYPEMSSRDVDLSGIWDKVRVLEMLYKKGDILKGKEAIDKILLELQMKEITKRQLMLFINDLFYSLKYNLQSSEKRDININKLQEDIHLLDEITTFSELAKWLGDKIVDVFSGHEAKDMKPKGLIPVILNWIHTNYQYDISLQQFAADNHVSLGYLSRLFKSQTGYTFSDYLIRYRIGKAKELLIDGVDRMSDVGSLVGYEDPKHFRHVFKKIVGEPPNSYVKRINGRP